MSFRDTKVPSPKPHFPTGYIVIWIIMIGFLCAGLLLATGLYGLFTGSY